MDKFNTQFLNPIKYWLNFLKQQKNPGWKSFLSPVNEWITQPDLVDPTIWREYLEIPDLNQPVAGSVYRWRRRKRPAWRAVSRI